VGPLKGYTMDNSSSTPRRVHKALALRSDSSSGERTSCHSRCPRTLLQLRVSLWQAVVLAETAGFSTKEAAQ
jgi:alkylated DNA repair dioxygenase AlkB